MRYTRVWLAGGWLFAALPGLAAEATDNFNRSNGGLGSNWTRNADDSGTLQIVGNRVQPAAETYGEAMYTAATYGGNQFTEVQHVSGLANGVINLVVRGRQYAAGGGTSDGYRGQINGFDSQWKIIRVDNDVETVLTYGSLSYADNDTFSFEAIGSTLRVRKNGVELGSIPDTLYTTGDVGVGTYNHVNLLVDNWRGGDIAGDTVRPTQVTGLSAVATSSSQINLTWTASTDNIGVTNYLIERCAGAGCSNFTQTNTSLIPSFSNINLSASTSYSYRVYAADAAGNTSLNPSNTATAITQAGTTQATDDFNRANGGLGTNWTTNAGMTGTLQIISNQVLPTTYTYGQSLYTAQSFGANQFSEVQYVSGLAGGVINLVVRAREYTTAGTTDSYRGQINGLSGQWRILRVDNGVETELRSGSLTHATGDLYYFEANGSTLTLKRNGITLDSYSGDSTYTSGDTGVGVYNHVNLLVDNWRGGQLGGGGDTQAPTQPANLAVVASSASEIDLVWTASTDNVAVTGYRVQRCQGAGCTPTSPEVATPALPYYNDMGRSASTSYTYRVQAFDAANNPSSWSTQLTVVTPAASADCNF